MLVWVTKGPYGGSYIDMEDSVAAEAIEDGWAQDPRGKSSTDMANPSKESHPGADAYADAHYVGGNKKPGLSYATREMRAAPADREMVGEKPVKKPKKD
jgi:hypothetical protein